VVRLRVQVFPLALLRFTAVQVRTVQALQAPPLDKLEPIAVEAVTVLMRRLARVEHLHRVLLITPIEEL